MYCSQGYPKGHFHYYTLKNSELAKNWPASGQRLWWISTNENAEKKTMK